MIVITADSVLSKTTRAELQEKWALFVKEYERSQWRSIKDAPKDGTSILAVREGIIRVVNWHSGAWFLCGVEPGPLAAENYHDVNFFTHWRPLPVPPERKPE